MLSQTGIDFFSTVFIVFFFTISNLFNPSSASKPETKITYIYNLSTKCGKQCKEVLDFLQQMDKE